MEKETLDKINKLTRRPLTEDEVYVFSVVLCDNEIDRDGERFSDESLEELKKRFVGKTGIFDHDPTAVNQNARIFDTELVTDNLRTTTYGNPYKYLKASAYMVRTDENRNLISEIDGGIKKEVSISCSVAKRICSICGCDKNKIGCSHIKGKSYGDKQCCTILSDITDAYEWSFVAVPAQVNAGVTKKHSISSKSKGGITMNGNEDFKPIETKEEFEAAINSAIAESEKRFEGWISPEDAAALTKERDDEKAVSADLAAKNRAYELNTTKMKIAYETGIPLELAEKLSGETEKDIKADAEKLSKYLSKSVQPLPKFSGEQHIKSTQEAAYLSMLQTINNK